MIDAGATMGAAPVTDPGADPSRVSAAWRYQRVHPKGVRGSGRPALNTRTSEGRAQVDRAFDAWLPAAVACAPGIRWDMAPATVKRYLVLWVGQGPDALVIALAMGCLCTYGGAGRAHLYSTVTAINTLLRRLRRVCGLTTLAQLESTKKPGISSCCTCRWDRRLHRPEAWIPGPERVVPLVVEHLRPHL